MKRDKDIEDEKGKNFDSPETAFDRAIRRMEERDACLERMINSPAIQAIENAASNINQNQIAITQTLAATLEPYNNVIAANSGVIEAVSSIVDATHSLVSDNAMTNSLCC